MATHASLGNRSAATAPQTRKHAPPQWVSLVAGGVAGGVEVAVTYPFEYSKTRVQLQHQGPGPVTTSNPVRLIFHVARQDGLRVLYTGCSTLIIGTAAKVATRFLSFDTIRRSLSDERGKLSAGRGIVAGMAAGAVESIVAVTPSERIKTALIDDAKQAKRFKSSPHAIALLVKSHGIQELYRGLVSTTLKQSATSAVRMGTYNFLREHAKSRGIVPTVFTNFGIGALAGVVTVYATQPFDTVKTRAQGVHGAGIGEAIRGMMRDHGIRGFWKGSSMRLGRLLLSGGIVFSVYEEIVAVLSPSRFNG